ncbi:MAG: EthD family reductase [Gammaproteobacteria bacterium]|nr:EthD family reductase [Gammaproteobacteria bacterium]
MKSPDQTLIVLFRLKPGADVSAYESWARNTDLPIVRKLPSVAGFEVFRAASLLGSGDRPPYDYVEVITIKDMTGFGSDVATDAMRRVAGEFRQFADNPVFILTDKIS